MRWFLIAVGVTAVCFAVDQPVARWVGTWEPSEVWGRGVEVLEWSIGLPVWKWLSAFVVVGGMLATVIVPRWRVYAHAWMLIAGTHVIARAATGWIKDGTGRLRPSQWTGGDTFWRDGVSFPSGHVVLFASLVIPIVVLRPRWWGLLGIVGFVMIARVAVSAHFVSDTTAAVALVIGVVVAIRYAVARGGTGRT